MSKLLCIYSVTGDYNGGIKNIDGKDGIYIYPNSHTDVENLSIGDIVLFFSTKKQKVILFKITEENFLYKDDHTEKQKYFLLIDNESKKEYKLSIGDFKNLYFLNIDTLKPWIKSPLQYYKNTLIFENKEHIILDYLNYEKISSVLEKPQKYIRKYHFTYNIDGLNNLLKGEIDDFQNIVTHIEKDSFSNEYSVFYKEGKNDILNFKISFDELKYKKNNQKRLQKIIEDKSFTTDSYGIYYEITRTNLKDPSIEDISGDNISYLYDQINQKIDKQDFYNILISLETSNFLIFSGPSGTGKSSIVKIIAENINGLDEKNEVIGYKKIPIKSNFSDETSLLGYWNPLLSKYEGTETLGFLIESYQNQDKPYFLLLDEMNLSRIENYFSDFLAKLDELKDNDESSEVILFETQIDNLSKILSIKNLVKRYNLDVNFIKSDIKDFENIKVEYKKSDDGKLNYIPDKISIDEVDYSFDSNNKIKDKFFNFNFFIKLSKNLKVIGTINEDETTQSLSNKVLDRSQFITFEIGDLFGKRNEYFDLPKTKIDLINYEYQDYNIINENKIFEEKVHNHKTNIDEQISEILNKVNKLIIKINQNESIAYRVIGDIGNYLKEFTHFEDKTNFKELQKAFDYQLAQKVLTKLKTFNLNNDTQKEAFNEIGEIFGFERDEKKDIEQMKGFTNYPKTLKFYNSLYSNLLDE